MDHDEITPRPSPSLKGRVAIITGAGSQSPGLGNGRAAAILLAEAGALIVCVDINLDSAQATVSMIDNEFGSGHAMPFQADVTREEDCKRAVETAVETYGRLDILVNNVGSVGAKGTAVEVTPAGWARGLELNLTSMMLMTKYAVPAMERNKLDIVGGRGSIVNISSTVGLIGGVPMLMYPTAKGAIVQMTKVMAAHHGAMGIRVNCVCPGMVYTPIVNAVGMAPDLREARRQRNLLKTEGNGWDSGCAVRFLASDEARWITGAILPVDAGYVAAIVEDVAAANLDKILTEG